MQQTTHNLYHKHATLLAYSYCYDLVFFRCSARNAAGLTFTTRSLQEAEDASDERYWRLSVRSVVRDHLQLRWRCFKTALLCDLSRTLCSVRLELIDKVFPLQQAAGPLPRICSLIYNHLTQTEDTCATADCQRFVCILRNSYKLSRFLYLLNAKTDMISYIYYDL